MINNKKKKLQSSLYFLFHWSISMVDFLSIPGELFPASGSDQNLPQNVSHRLQPGGGSQETQPDTRCLSVCPSVWLPAAEFSSRPPLSPGQQDEIPTLPARLVPPFLRLLLRFGGHVQAEGQVQPERLQGRGEEEGGDRRNVPCPQEHRLQRWQHLPAACLLRLPGVSGRFGKIQILISDFPGKTKQKKLAPSRVFLSLFQTCERVQ